MSAFPAKKKKASLENSGMNFDQIRQSRNLILTEITTNKVGSQSFLSGGKINQSLSYKNAILQENDRLKVECEGLEEKSKL